MNDKKFSAAVYLLVESWRLNRDGKALLDSVRELGKAIDDDDYEKLQ